MEVNAKFCTYEGKDLQDGTMYRQLVESLIYLTLTRPNILYAVSVMSQYIQNSETQASHGNGLMNIEICEKYNRLQFVVQEM